MSAINKSFSLTALLAGSIVLLAVSSGFAQVPKRYEPSRPTVSPYLNLFRFNNSVIPNYQSLVRPEVQAQRFKQQQDYLNRQQTQSIGQLKSEVQVLQQPGVKTGLVAPTGKGSWFNVPGGSQFNDTRGYFSRSGGGQ